MIILLLLHNWGGYKMSQSLWRLVFKIDVILTWVVAIGIPAVYAFYFSQPSLQFLYLMLFIFDAYKLVLVWIAAIILLIAYRKWSNIGFWIGTAFQLIYSVQYLPLIRMGLHMFWEQLSVGLFFVSLIGMIAFFVTPKENRKKQPKTDDSEDPFCWDE